MILKQNYKNLEQINKEIYTYTLMLKQISAHYNSKKIFGIIEMLETLSYNFISNTNTNSGKVITTLKLCIINLHIDSINHRYKELVPICEYFQDLLNKLEMFNEK